MLLEPDVAGKVHQHQIGTSASDLEPEGIDRIGIEIHGNGRLAHPPAQRFTAHEQPVLLQPSHDDGNGLRGKSGQTRDFSFGKPGLPPDDGKHEALIIGPHPHLIGASG